MFLNNSKVSSSEKNIHRTLQNVRNLETLGVTSRNKLLKVFDKASQNGTFVNEVVGKFGTTVTRSVNVGSKGKVEVKFFYEAGKELPKITTIIPKIFK